MTLTDCRKLLIVSPTPDPIARLFDIAERVFTVPIRGSDAGIDPVALASDATDAGIEAEPVSSVAEALHAIGRIVEEDAVAPRILIGGSLYLVGDLRKELRARFGVPGTLQAI